jgi:hypothetical protein
VKILTTFALIILATAGLACAAESQAGDALAAKAEQAWRQTWARFFNDNTGLFYDYISSYEPGHELDHLPTADEVKRQYPNPCGYGTGMEDGMILGGAMLSVIADRFDVTKEASLAADMRRVFKGVKLCTTGHGVPGFVARGVSPKDGTDIYINSSRDQYTHCVHGLWRYYHSAMCDDATRGEIRELLRAIADRMTRNVTPENDYDSLRADGQRDPLGISRMWNVKPHEAARLPMIYAAAWDATGDDKYYPLYRHYLVLAMEQSTSPDKGRPVYALLQMQCSLELLHDVEADAAIRSRLRELMMNVADLCRTRAAELGARLAATPADRLAMLGPDWRNVAEWKDQKGYLVPQWGEYRKVWEDFRGAGEAMLVPLMVEHPTVTDEQRQWIQKIIAQSDYDHVSGCGIVYHVATYWKARKLALFNPAPNHTATSR